MDGAILVAVILAILFFSTLVRSTFGFGDAIVAMPLLAFAVDLDIARPLVALVSTTISLVVLRRDWRQLGGSGIWILVVAAVAGIPLGFYVADRLDETVVKLILAIIIVVYAAYRLTQPGLPEMKSKFFGVFFGFLAGVLGGAYNTAGPPLVIYAAARKLDAQKFRATLQGAYLPIAVVTLLGHAQQGKITGTVMSYYLYCLPLVVLAVTVGRYLNQRFHGERFTIYVHFLLILIGMALLIYSTRALMYAI